MSGGGSPVVIGQGSGQTTGKVGTPADDRREVRLRSCSPTPRTPGRSSSRRAARPTRFRRWCCSPARRRRPAASPARRSGRSIVRATRRSTSTSPSIDELDHTLQRAGRFRRGLCHRPRDRPPRAEPARHPAEGRRGAAQRRRGPGEPALGAARIAGRLLAGVWANAADAAGILEVGDIDEALNAAAQIGDDTLQRQSQGCVVPGQLHPRHGRAAQPLVQAWLPDRRPEHRGRDHHLQHVRQRPALGTIGR